jgi:phage protein D
MSLEIAIYVNRVPAPLLAELVNEVTVEQVGDGTSRYRVVFQADIVRGDYQILNDPLLLPSFLGVDNELALIVFDHKIPKCLIHGPIEERAFDGRAGGPGSLLTVTGSDRTIVMDRVDQQIAWRGTESLTVTAIVTAHKLAPSDIEATTVPYDDVHGLLLQTSSDLTFVRELARKNGFNFWLTAEVAPLPAAPGSTVVDVAHFRTAPPRLRPTAPPSPPLATQTALPILRLNAASESIPGLQTTINRFESTTNTEVPYVVTGYRLDENTGVVVPIVVARNPANSVPFGSVPIEAAAPRVPPTLQISGAGGVLEANTRAEAALAEAAFFVNASVETTREAAGALIEPNMFVRVEGVGGVDQGQYWVDAVTHTIDASCHRMSVQLRRNAQGVAI